MDSNEHEEKNQDGPNIFGYYYRGVALLLANNDLYPDEVDGARTSPKSNSLFGNQVPNISNFKKENLEIFLTQAKLDLSAEFDLERQSILKLHEVITILRRNNQEETRSVPEGRCPKRMKKTAPSISIPQSHEDADLQLLLESNGPGVEILLNKYLNEQYKSLAYKVQQMDKILDEFFSLWRPMTHPEKQQLQKLIKELPQHHLNVIVNLLTSPEAERSEIFVDLNKEDNRTLWKIFHYITKALSSSS